MGELTVSFGGLSRLGTKKEQQKDEANRSVLRRTSRSVVLRRFDPPRNTKASHALWQRRPLSSTRTWSRLHRFGVQTIHRKDMSLLRRSNDATTRACEKTK